MDVFSFSIDQSVLSAPQMKAGVINEIYIATILREILKGLDYLHSEGKLHRDIKGTSTILTGSWQTSFPDQVELGRRLGHDLFLGKLQTVHCTTHFALFSYCPFICLSK